MNWSQLSGWTRGERLVQDVRHAVRLLRRRPLLSITAIVTLMLAIGSTTAVFSLLHALHLRTLPVANPGALVRLVETAPTGAALEAFTLLTHATMQRASRTLSDVVASSTLVGRPDDILVGDEPARAVLQLVSDNYFDALGVGAARGRVFHQPPPGSIGEPIAIVSDGYWRRQHGADPSILGRRVRWGTRELTIAGIAPPGFRGTELDAPVDIWVSIDQVVAPDADERVRGRWMRVLGRLQPGATSEQAAAEASAILGRPVRFETGGIGYSQLRHRLRQPLLLVALMVVLVLLIACANLANLLLSATVSRDREIAMRAAIGASRRRIVRQLIVESLVLALLGGVLGLVVAYSASAALLAFLPPAQASALPNLRLALDARVLAFVLALSVGTCLLFGVAPALRVTGRVAAAIVRTGSGAGRRNRSVASQGLVVSQVVMCTALLVVAGVFVRSVQNLRGQDAGYLEDGLVVADVDFPRGYTERRRDQVIEELRARAASLPGVETAAFSHVGQLSGGAIEFRIGFAGQSPDGERTSIEQRISPDFLRAMGTSLTAGRDITAADDERAPLVAIVNEAFARRFLPGRDPIGARFFRYTGVQAGAPMEIVGVVRDSKWVSLRDDGPPMYYRPYRQMGGSPAMRLAVRASAQPDRLARELTGLAQSIDRQVRLSNVVPFREIVNRTLVVERLVAQVSTAFGALSLAIAAVGLYGVLACSVARRRREIGVRVAVGARPGSIERMFLKESLALVAVGVALGIPIAIAVARLAASLLFGLSAHDPASIAAALTALTLTTVAAAWLPARRAARVDPIHALREE